MEPTQNHVYAYAHIHTEQTQGNLYTYARTLYMKTLKKTKRTYMHK